MDQAAQFNNSKPIWAQLVDEFARRIVSGYWQPGSKVPSVRELALEFGVNPNTVQKAWAELERMGLVLTQRASGRYLTEDQELIAQIQSKFAATASKAFVAEMRGLAVTKTAALQLVEALWDLNQADQEKE